MLPVPFFIFFCAVSVVPESFPREMQTSPGAQSVGSSRIGHVTDSPETEASLVFLYGKLIIISSGNEVLLLSLPLTRCRRGFHFITNHTAISPLFFSVRHTYRPGAVQKIFPLLLNYTNKQTEEKINVKRSVSYVIVNKAFEYLNWRTWNQ